MKWIQGERVVPGYSFLWLGRLLVTVYTDQDRIYWTDLHISWHPDYEDSSWNMRPFKCLLEDT
jgi:hypothetical protein